MTLKKKDLFIVVALYLLSFGAFLFLPESKLIAPFFISHILFIPAIFLVLRITGQGLERFSHIAIGAIVALGLCSIPAILNHSFEIFSDDPSVEISVMALFVIMYSFVVSNLLLFLVRRWEGAKEA